MKCDTLWHISCHRMLPLKFDLYDCRFVIVIFYFADGKCTNIFQTFSNYICQNTIILTNLKLCGWFARIFLLPVRIDLRWALTSPSRPNWFKFVLNCTAANKSKPWQLHSCVLWLSEPSIGKWTAQMLDNAWDSRQIRLWLWGPWSKSRGGFDDFLCKCRGFSSITCQKIMKNDMFAYPIGSMYGIITNIYPKITPM